MADHEPVDDDEFDVVVIGAGLYGIQAARYYLDIHPEAEVCVLEAEDVVGGTWSAKRIYDAFWTQTPIGMAEFSDRPMTPPPPEDQYYGFFPARYVTAYLESYVENHIYSGRTLRDRIFFNVQVEKIERTADDRWRIYRHGDSELVTPKLIDATGLTSRSNMPHLTGEGDFRGKIIHHKNFGQLGDLKAVEGQNVAVLGGGKSAADVAYAAAKAGKNVSWIVRADGSGPAAFLSAEGRGPYANSNESFYTRLVASFLPNPFKDESYLSAFLHRTFVGRWLFATMWNAIDKGNKKRVNYKRAEGTNKGFQKLEPDTPIFWQNDSSGINQRPDLYSTIATKVHVYRQNIDHVTTESVILAAGVEAGLNTQKLPVDVFVFCTGWSPISSIYDAKQAEGLGLPTKLDRSTNLTEPKQQCDRDQRSQALESVNDRMIVERFPMLERPPSYKRARPSHTPFRLYKAMIPETTQDQHSIAFLGKMVVGNNFLASEVQALWAVAYLDGKLKLDKGTVEKEIDETVAWCRRRYLNKGVLGSWFYFDVIDYVDMLLAQLNLKSHRHKGWFKDYFSPYRAEDLKNLVEEYKSLYPLGRL